MGNINEKDTSPEQETAGGCCEMGVETEGRTKCPMAKMCEGMLTNSKVGFVFLIPGVLFTLGGILILFEPKALVWLMGGTSILLGLVMFAVTAFLRKLGSRVKEAQPAGRPNK